MEILIFLILLYFAPWFIALARSHPQSAAICILTLFLGWTLIGWVWALVWAFTNSPVKTPPEMGAPTPSLTSEDLKTCPDCAESIKKAALKCRFCGHSFGGPVSETA